MIFDPVLEADQAKISTPAPLWDAAWIWYPGQLGAHLNTNVFQKAIRRCTHIGFPGNFRQPEYHAEFRLRAALAEDVLARWAMPPGRTRVRINGREGDITVRQARIPRGDVEILVAVDLTVSLPCFLLEAPGLSTGPGWEVTLDGDRWVPVESQHPAGCPDRLPDLDIDIHLPLRPRTVVSSQGRSQPEGVYPLEPGGELVLDFWHNELGELQIEALGAGSLDIFVGESIAEVMENDPARSEQLPLAPIALSACSRNYTLPERCLRYARFRASAGCEIRDVIFHARIYPVIYRGWFESDDESLNQIWKAGAATLHSNIHDATIVDGLKRDALVWLFDENIDFDGTDLVFFDREIVRNTLASKTPPPNPRRKDIGILDMRLYYILGFYQDYLVSGDPSYIHRYRQSLTDLLDLLETLQDECGFIPARAFSPQAEGCQAEAGVVEGVDYLSEYGPDWAAKSDRAGEVRPTDLDVAGTPAYAQMMLMRVFEIGAIFARLWGQEPPARHYQDKAARLGEAIRTAFWDEGRGAFINGFTRGGQPDERLSLYAQAWGILTGLLGPGDTRRAVEALVNLDPRPKNISMSTYWEYLAYLKAGRFDLALAQLRRYWGGMLDQGLSRFIEDIRPDDQGQERWVFYQRPYALSLNHGWAGACAVSILMRGALGLNLLEPGYRQVELTPEWRGFNRLALTIPTPLGNLALDYTRGGSEILEIPAGMQVRLLDGERVRDFRGPGTFNLVTS